MRFSDVIHAIADNHRQLSADEARFMVESMLDGTFTLAQAGGILVGLRIRGESPEIIAGGTRALFGRARHFSPSRRPIGDFVSMGFDPQFNYVPVASSLLCASVGCAVCNHGDRPEHGGISEVVQALGFALAIPRSLLREGIEKQGYGFAFDPTAIPSLGVLFPMRRDLDLPTALDHMLQLANPCSPEVRVVGVETSAQVTSMQGALGMLGVKRGYVIAGADGMAMATVHAPATCTAFETRGATAFRFDPQKFGFAPCRREDIATPADAQQAAKLIKDILSGAVRGPTSDMVVANAAFLIHALGGAPTLEASIIRAQHSISSSSASRFLTSVTELYHTLLDGSNGSRDTGSIHLEG